MTATCYHGNRTPAGTAIIAHDWHTGSRDPLRHVIRHSPTGLEWGYGGSGPADLARSLLIDALGPAAACPVCHGAGQVAFDEATGHDEAFDPARHDAAAAYECICDDGFRQLPYQDFKWDVVSKWQGDQWRIGRPEIIGWLINHGCDVLSWVAEDTRAAWLGQLARAVDQSRA